MAMIDMFNGLQIFTDPNHCTLKQTKFPRSKKARMRKKWRKQLKNYTEIPREPFVIKVAGREGIIMHPKQAKQLADELSRRNSSSSPD